MSRIVWDQSGQRYWETGTDHCVLYLAGVSGNYTGGVAWNGITGITESPEGAENTDLWADNIKYASIRATETFGGTIEAFTYPAEFEQCDGSAAIATGVKVGQQKREKFGLCYRTQKGNDLTDNAGYLLHLVYGCTCSPSERAYATINDSPEAITFSWEFDTTPVNAGGDLKPTSIVVIDSTLADPALLEALENTLYGTENTSPTLPLPGAIATLFAGNPTYTYTPVSEPAAGTNPMASGWYEVIGGTGTTEDPYVYAKTTDTALANGKTYYTLVVTNPT